MKKLISLLLQMAALLVLGAATSGCPGGGDSGDVNLGSTPAGGAGGLLNLQITTIEGLGSGSWIKDGGGQVYLDKGAVSLGGTCTRGVTTILATVNGLAVVETASCQADGSFVWTKTFSGPTPATGTAYDIILNGADVDGAPLAGVSDEKHLVVDLTPPSAPVLNALAGCHLSLGAWVCASPNIQVTGSWSAVEGVASLQFPAFGTATYPSATTFTFNLVLVDGQSRLLSFTVRDLAGNISGQSSETVVYASPTTSLASSVNAGGTLGFAGGPLSTAPSMIANVGTLSGRSFDLISAQPLAQRAQLQIGPVAIGALYDKP